MTTNESSSLSLASGTSGASRARTARSPRGGTRGVHDLLEEHGMFLDARHAERVGTAPTAVTRYRTRRRTRATGTRRRLPRTRTKGPPRGTRSSSPPDRRRCSSPRSTCSPSPRWAAGWAPRWIAPPPPPASYWQQRRVEEVVAGRHQDDVVRFRLLQGLDEGDGAPARAEDHHSLAARAGGGGDLRRVDGRRRVRDGGARRGSGADATDRPGPRGGPRQRRGAAENGARGKARRRRWTWRASVRSLRTECSRERCARGSAKACLDDGPRSRDEKTPRSRRHAPRPRSYRRRGSQTKETCHLDTGATARAQNFGISQI